MKGFTLIELLVTLTIIVILATIGFLTLKEVILGARDGKRQTDLKQIQSYLEQYRTDQAYYPVTAALNTQLGNEGTFTNCTGAAAGSCIVTKTYLNKVPLDPLNVSPNKYCYTALPANCDNSTNNFCTSYNLFAKLEKVSGGVLSCTHASGTVSSYNLQVTPP